MLTGFFWSLAFDTWLSGATPATAPVAPPAFTTPACSIPRRASTKWSSNCTGDPARRTAYQPVLDYLQKHPVPTTFPAVVYAVAGAGSLTEDQIRRDAELAYAWALRWAATSDAAAARQTRAILDGYARTFQCYDTAPKPDGSPTPFRQAYLEAAWVAPTFVAAAEIMRYYRPRGGVGVGWPAADVAQFSEFLITLKSSYIDPLPAGTSWVNNWQV